LINAFSEEINPGARVVSILIAGWPCGTRSRKNKRGVLRQYYGRVKCRMATIR